MSKQTIETDAERSAREAATITVGKNAHGEPAHALLAFDPNVAPSGALVQLPLGSKLKKGWRWATKEEVKKNKAA
jgi:hypothetical protein